MAKSPNYKVPQSVLVVIHTPALEVLLLRRTDSATWQSVTGAKKNEQESFKHTAVREVAEETGIACGPGSALAGKLRDCGIDNEYDIYPQYLPRYAPGVKRNQERVFMLELPEPMAIRLSPHEHTAYQWLPWKLAAETCFSATNTQAILMLPRLSKKP